jgi:hypothetical protein
LVLLLKPLDGVLELVGSGVIGNGDRAAASPAGAPPAAEAAAGRPAQRLELLLERLKLLLQRLQPLLDLLGCNIAGILGYLALQKRLNFQLDRSYLLLELGPLGGVGVRRGLAGASSAGGRRSLRECQRGRDEAQNQCPR